MLKKLHCALALSAFLLISGTASAKIAVTSTAFTDGGLIPAKYSCDAQNPPNPPLAFSGVPQNAKSLVLIVEDVDIPTSMMPAGVFDHWIVVDISPDSKGFKEGNGAQGLNGMGKPGYIGPCPRIASIAMSSPSTRSTRKWATPRYPTGKNLSLR
jgi:phosphatidylethanolamine-binding protein (PEBP) family uncharacterized protein